jgi:hypothetical protein
MKSEIWVETLCDLSLLLVKVDNLPELVLSSGSLVEYNLLSFGVLNSIDGSTISEVDKASSLDLKELPPLLVSVPYLEGVSLT